MAKKRAPFSKPQIKKAEITLRWLSRIGQTPHMILRIGNHSIRVVRQAAGGWATELRSDLAADAQVLLDQVCDQCWVRPAAEADGFEVI